MWSGCGSWKLTYRPLSQFDSKRRRCLYRCGQLSFADPFGARISSGEDLVGTEPDGPVAVPGRRSRVGDVELSANTSCILRSPSASGGEAGRSASIMSCCSFHGGVVGRARPAFVTRRFSWGSGTSKSACRLRGFRFCVDDSECSCSNRRTASMSMCQPSLM